VDPPGVADRPILHPDGAQMASLSTHVLDVEAGVPAAGVPVTLTRMGSEPPVVVASATTDQDGRIGDLAPQLPAGAYRLDFDVAAYLRQQGRAVTFLRRIVVEFEAQEGGGHYHVPLLTSRYAFTSYRGS
jgi:5-hydroxyisourate hydrolase